MYGLPYRITSKVTEFVDGQVVEWRHPMGHRWRWELSSSADGKTQVTEIGRASCRERVFALV